MLSCLLAELYRRPEAFTLHSPSAQRNLAEPSVLLGATSPAGSLASGYSWSTSAPGTSSPPQGAPGLPSPQWSWLPVPTPLPYHPPQAPSTHSCCPQLYHRLQPERGQGHSSGAPPVSNCVTFDHLFQPFFKMAMILLPLWVKKDSTSFYIQSAWNSAGHIVSAP